MIRIQYSRRSRVMRFGALLFVAFLFLASCGDEKKDKGHEPWNYTLVEPFDSYGGDVGDVGDDSDGDQEPPPINLSLKFQKIHETENTVLLRAYTDQLWLLNLETRKLKSLSYFGDVNKADYYGVLLDYELSIEKVLGKERMVICKDRRLRVLDLTSGDIMHETDFFTCNQDSKYLKDLFKYKRLSLHPETLQIAFLRKKGTDNYLTLFSEDLQENKTITSEDFFNALESIENSPSFEAFHSSTIGLDYTHILWTASGDPVLYLLLVNGSDTLPLEDQYVAPYFLRIDRDTLLPKQQLIAEECRFPGLSYPLHSKVVLANRFSSGGSDKTCVIDLERMEVEKRLSGGTHAIHPEGTDTLFMSLSSEESGDYSKVLKMDVITGETQEFNTTDGYVPKRYLEEQEILILKPAEGDQDSLILFHLASGKETAINFPPAAFGHAFDRSLENLYFLHQNSMRFIHVADNSLESVSLDCSAYFDDGEDCRPYDLFAVDEGALFILQFYQSRDFFLFDTETKTIVGTVEVPE